MTCNKCGSVCKDDAKFCEVCGAAIEAPQAAPAQNAQQNAGFTPAPGYANAAPAAAPAVEEPGKGMAIASLICGIVSFVCGCCAPIPNILAIVFGLVAKSKGSKNAMSTVGIILGAAAIVFSIIGWIIYFTTGIFAGVMDSMYYY